MTLDAESATVKAAGPSAWLVRVPGGISTEAHHRVLALRAALVREKFSWLGEIVPAYNTLLVRAAEGAVAPLDTTAALLALARTAAQQSMATQRTDASVHEIPVFYDASVAPDLERLAAEKHLAPPELVERHACATYEVHALGFRPGFPFLSGLDPVLATPRLSTPRLHVAAGSVAIGGAQTGIYPVDGPGGWHVIGRTPLTLFDVARTRPSLLAVGDQVRFVPIERARFTELGG